MTIATPLPQAPAKLRTICHRLITALPLQSKLVPWLFGVLILGADFFQATELIRVRYKIALALIVLGWIGWSVRKRLQDLIFDRLHGLPRKKLAGVLFLLSLLLPLSVQQSITIPFLSWCLVALLLLEPPGKLEERQQTNKRTETKLVFGLAAATFTLVTLIHFNIRSKPVVIDENLYLLESTLFTAPSYGRAIDKSLQPFFVLNHSYIMNDRLHGQYPPGYPLILKLFSLINLQSWANSFFASTAVALTYFLGKRLWGVSAGAIAALLIATNPLFLFYSGMYLPHTLGLMLVALAGLLLISGENATFVGRRLGWLGAGFLLGLLLTVRPLTGAAVSFSLLAWLLIRRNLELKQLKVLGVLFVVGALAPTTFLLHYNTATNGHPLIFGYQAATKELHSLGWGKKSVTSYDNKGNPIEYTINVTPTRAVKDNLQAIYEAGTLLLPAFIIFPVLLLSYVYGFPLSWKTIVVFLPLVLVHSVYAFPGVRFLIEILPFVCVGMAGMLSFLQPRRRFLVQSLVIFMLICNVGFSARIIYEEYAFRRQYFAQFKKIDDFRKTHGKVLAFVKGPGHREWFFEALYYFNIDNFPGDIVVARDRGEQNSILRNKFPQHRPVYISG